MVPTARHASFVLLPLLAIGLMSVGCVNRGLPECPVAGEWSGIFAKGTREQPPVSPTGQIALSSPITDIPEFHDCQRFLVLDPATEKLRFDSLFAIFARFQLDSAPVDSLFLDPTTPGVPVATIYSYASKYAPLGIFPNFNCLYFFNAPNAPSRLEARMVPVDNDQQSCTTRRPVQDTAGVTLLVDRIEVPNAVDSDYPPVARWDWDSANVRQYIGIRCGRAWCEVHAKDGANFAPTARYKRSVSSAEDRVIAIKGWYDEQRLADKPTWLGHPVVSSLKATIVPDPSLGDDHSKDPDTSSYAGHWRRAAWIGLDGPPGKYKNTLNLVPSTVGEHTNSIFLCYGGSSTGPSNPCFHTGSPPKCDTKKNPGGDFKWWARIGPDTVNSKPFCIINRTHDGIRVPGIVRWRWTIDDDTVWMRCLEGCCEVQADT